MGQRLGQHFLTNDYYAKLLAEAVAVREGETIVEVGPGKGALTKHLLATGAQVVAIEKDEALAAALPATFPSANLRVITGDIRDFFSHASHLVPRTYCVAANIPYYITGEIIRSFLEAEQQPRALALLIQKEVAERIVARDGKESLLSISVKAYGTPELVRVVKAGAFSPPPRVESAILAIHEISREKFADKRCEERVFTLAHLAFSTKRKKIGTSLKGALSANIFDRCVVPPSSRPEELTVKQWLCLAT